MSSRVLFYNLYIMCNQPFTVRWLIRYMLYLQIAMDPNSSLILSEVLPVIFSRNMSRRLAIIISDDATCQYWMSRLPNWQILLMTSRAAFDVFER